MVVGLCKLPSLGTNISFCFSQFPGMCKSLCGKQRAPVAKTELLVTPSVACLSQHNVLSVTASDAAAT